MGCSWGTGDSMTIQTTWQVQKARFDHNTFRKDKGVLDSDFYRNEIASGWLGTGREMERRNNRRLLWNNTTRIQSRHVVLFILQIFCAAARRHEIPAGKW